MYLRVKADWVQPNLRAYLRQPGASTGFIGLNLPAGQNPALVEVGSAKSAFGAGQEVRFGIFTNDLPVKGPGSVVAELVRAGVVIAGPVTRDNTNPPRYDQGSQSAESNMTVTLPQ
ncbi:hypothetical protein [Hymenobacter persicinus]|uniref:Uncharacterized protein n=1 Tax=Hymenobacter persicinus TaxID=2025506 RepID=A0A4Q5LEX2_9BACT|nr:hypothetical protein [Hymenobacter persicinus]RYU83256.1 hypothetical protein EWM57_02925 [Hymenobacter persicinus]